MGKFRLKVGMNFSRAGDLLRIEECEVPTIYGDFPFYAEASEGIFDANGRYSGCKTATELDIIETLAHRLHRVLCSTNVPGLISTDDGQPYPLIDLLSDGDTIEGGFARLQSITEQILAGLFLEWEESKGKHPWPKGLARRIGQMNKPPQARMVLGKHEGQMHLACYAVLPGKAGCYTPDTHRRA